jgi:photosystem II stability/assembly factor-like uncharacterized protein
MGYAATDDGFYSSGHPAPMSGLANPLGLVKSTDGGATLTTLGFGGESDFHLMGVGYHNHAMYVLNTTPNARLSVGLYRSLDDGQTWQQGAMQNVEAQVLAIAVHPNNPAVVALATEAGLLLSTDQGNTFEPIGAAEPVTAVSFSPDGTHLLFGATQLQRYDLANQQSAPLPTPKLAPQDALSYIAANATQANEIAIATFERNIHRSVDAGQSWQQIVHEGTSVQPTE